MKALRFTFLMPFILLRISLLFGQCTSYEVSAHSLPPSGVNSSMQYKRDSAYLYTNAPGPAHKNTRIHYVLSSSSKNAAIYFYDAQGHAVLYFDILLPGEGKLEILGNTLPPGVYLCSLIVDGYIHDTQSMVLTQ